jgi:hypothetical protein
MLVVEDADLVGVEKASHPFVIAQRIQMPYHDDPVIAAQDTVHICIVLLGQKLGGHRSTSRKQSGRANMPQVLRSVQITTFLVPACPG